MTAVSAWTMLDRVFGAGGVLAYHGVGEAPHAPVMHVSPTRLRAQLEFVRDRYTVLPLRELVARWESRRTTKDCVAITFDDAYAGVLRWAAPLLRELDLSATVFVATDHARVGAAYWWDDAERDRLATAGPRWEALPAAVGLESLDPEGASAMEQVRHQVLAAFAGRWPGGVVVAAAATPWRSLRFDELRELAADGRVDFGVHTVSHPALPLLDAAEQAREIRDCHAELQATLPRVLPILAYPYGLYDRGTVAVARAAGMRAAVTMEGRAPGSRPSPFTIPRVGVGELHAPGSLQKRLSRAMRPALVLRNRGLHPVVPRRISPATR